MGFDLGKRFGGSAFGVGRERDVFFLADVVSINRVKSRRARGVDVRHVARYASK